MGGEDLSRRIRAVAEERGVTPCQALFAVFLASLAEANILNQATANFLAKTAAPRLYDYLQAMGLLPEPGGDAERDTEALLRAVNEALGVGPRLVVEKAGEGVVEVGLGGDGCRYCPKAVGLAEIPWTACPFPRLLEGLLRRHGVEARAVPHEGGGLVEKREGLCWIRLRVGS